MTRDELLLLREHLLRSRDSTDNERGSTCNGCRRYMDTPEEQLNHESNCTYTTSLTIIDRELTATDEE